MNFLELAREVNAYLNKKREPATKFLSEESNKKNASTEIHQFIPI